MPRKINFVNVHVNGKNFKIKAARFFYLIVKALRAHIKMSLKDKD